MQEMHERDGKMSQGSPALTDDNIYIFIKKDSSETYTRQVQIDQCIANDCKHILKHYHKRRCSFNVNSSSTVS